MTVTICSVRVLYKISKQRTACVNRLPWISSILTKDIMRHIISPSIQLRSVGLPVHTSGVAPPSAIFIYKALLSTTMSAMPVMVLSPIMSKTATLAWKSWRIQLRISTATSESTP